MTEWFTSPANTAIACLLVIVLAFFAIRGAGRREDKPKRLQPEDIRQRLKKKSADCAGTQTTRSMEKHTNHIIQGGEENVKTL